MKQIETIPDSNRLPELVRDFCYNRQGFTIWRREREVFKDHTREGVYTCTCCEVERNYAVKGDSLKEKRV